MLSGLKHYTILALAKLALKLGHPHLELLERENSAYQSEIDHLEGELVEALQTVDGLNNAVRLLQMRNDQNTEHMNYSLGNVVAAAGGEVVISHDQLKAVGQGDIGVEFENLKDGVAVRVVYTKQQEPETEQEVEGVLA